MMMMPMMTMMMTMMAMMMKIMKIVKMLQVGSLEKFGESGRRVELLEMAANLLGEHHLLLQTTTQPF